VVETYVYEKFNLYCIAWSGQFEMAEGIRSAAVAECI